MLGGFVQATWAATASEWFPSNPWRLRPGPSIVAVLARFASGALPGEMWPLHLAGTAWILAFGGFAVIYAPMLALARPVQKRAMPRKTDAN